MVLPGRILRACGLRARVAGCWISGFRAQRGADRVARLSKFFLEVERLAGARPCHHDMRALLTIFEPEPEAPFADVEHREDAQYEEQAAKIHDFFAGRARQLKYRGLHLLEGIELQVDRRSIQKAVR